MLALVLGQSEHRRFRRQPRQCHHLRRIGRRHVGQPADDDSQASVLFRKAIVESGAGWEHGRSLKQAETAGAAFAAKLGAGPDAASLRAIAADKIIAGGDLNVAEGDAPILDGRLLRENPIDAFGHGRVASVPLLIGSNSLEFPGAFAGQLRARSVKLDAGPGGGAGESLWRRGSR